MKHEEYRAILDCIYSIGSNGRCVQTLAQKFPNVSVKTLGSILSQEYQRKTKKTHHRHNMPDRMDQYYHRYLNRVEAGQKNVIVTMAMEVDLAPALLARIIIERHLTYTEGYRETSVPKQVVSQLLKDPSRLQDPRLADDVFKCVLIDEAYGPVVDVIKHSVGQEYECLLKHYMDNNKLPYMDENQLRAQGYDKTPDIKLEIPFAVDGHIINWIESKASFGDDESHKVYLKDQFWSYWNRFGPGLVIYWFGFIDELDVHREKGIVLMDRFPKDIVVMNPLGLLSHRLAERTEHLGLMSDHKLPVVSSVPDSSSSVPQTLSGAHTSIPETSSGAHTSSNVPSGLLATATVLDNSQSLLTNEVPMSPGIPSLESVQVGSSNKIPNSPAHKA